MATYVLVHGAMHAAWCWAKIVPLLEKQGHKVVALDLPGHGKDDMVPIAEMTLQAYADRVCKVLDAQLEPVILVGHSMGGKVITQTAESRPDKIRALVYLTAALLRNGEGGTPLAPNPNPDRVLSDGGRSFTLRSESLKDRFYGDCSDGDVAWAKALLGPEATAVMQTPVRTSEENFGRVPRVFIECLQDKAIPLERQREMYTNLPCLAVLSLDTSHSPFLSAPVELVTHLLIVNDMVAPAGQEEA